MPGDADIELKVVADFSSLNGEVERAKAKLRELQRENTQLSRDVKDDTASLNENEKQLRKVAAAIERVKQVGAVNKNTMRDLRREYKELKDTNEQIRLGLDNSKIALKENAEALRAQKKVVEEAQNPLPSFRRALEKVSSTSKATDFVINTLTRRLTLLAAGLGTGAVLALGAAIAGPVFRAFGKWLGISGEIVEKQKKLAEYTQKAAESLAGEAAKVTELVAVAKSDVASREERYAAIKKLQEIAPQYFKDIDIEKSKISDLASAYDNYLESLKQRIRLEVNRAELNDNLEKQIALEDKIDKQTVRQTENEKKIAALREKANKALREGAVQTYQSISSQISGLQTEGVLNKMKSDLSRLKNEAAQLAGKISSATVFTGVNDVYSKLSAQLQRLNQQELTFGTNEAQKKIDAVKEAINSLMNQFKVPVSDVRISSLLEAITVYEKALPPVKAHSRALRENAKEIETVEAVLARMNEALANATTLEKVFGDDRSKEKISAISKAIEDLVIKLKQATDSDLIIELKKQIADLESSQKIDFRIQADVDFSAASAKLSDNSKLLNSLDGERKELIAKLRKAGFNSLPLGISFENATKEQLKEFFDEFQKSVISTAATITDILSPAFDNVFDAIFSGENAFDALKNSIQQIVQELIKAAARAAVFAAIVSALSGGTVSFGQAFSGGLRFAGGGMVQRRASGGYISGPGTSKSDSIPALLSNGEYVINAAMVQKFGKGFFDAINYGRSMPNFSANRFANGGIVGSNIFSSISSSGMNVSGEFRIRGTDLIAAIERGEKQKRRFT